MNLCTIYSEAGNTFICRFFSFSLVWFCGSVTAQHKRSQTQRFKLFDSKGFALKTTFALHFLTLSQVNRTTRGFTGGSNVSVNYEYMFIYKRQNIIQQVFTGYS